MARNAAIRRLLQSRLNIKTARLYAIAKGVSDSLSISTSDAILLLAAKNGINLQKQGGGLPSATIDRIRSLLPYLASSSGSISSESTTGHDVGAGRARPSERKKRVSRVRLLKSKEDAILTAATLDEMKAMTAIYETLYHLENSIRQFISRVLRAKHGANWWDKAAPRGLRDTVDKRTVDDKINAWHQKRSTDEINYLDLDQLPALVRQTQLDFVPDFFPTLEWFQQFVEEVYRSRCVVCHMNPLISTNIDAVHVRFNQWQQLMRSRLDQLSTLEGRGRDA